MSFLLAPALLLSSTPYASTLLWVLIWLSLTYAIAAVFIKSICQDSLSFSLFILLLLTSPFLSSSVLTLAWNRVFSLLFHLLILIFSYHWIEKQKEVYLLPIGLMIGLGVQLDYSILFHLPGLLMFFLTQEKILNGFDDWKEKETKTKAFEWKYALAFLTLTILPSSLYLLAYGKPSVDLPKINWHQLHWFIQDFLQKPSNRLSDFAENIDFNKERLFSLSPLLSLVFYSVWFQKEKREDLIHLTFLSLSPLCAILISHNGFYFINLGLLLLLTTYHDHILPKNQTLKILLFLFYGLTLVFPFSFEILLFLNVIFYLGVLITYFQLSFKKTLSQLVSSPFRVSWLQNQQLSRVSQTLLARISQFLFCVFLTFYFWMLAKISYQSHFHQLKSLMLLVEEQSEWKTEKALRQIFTVGLKGRKNRSLAFAYQLAQEENQKKISKNNTNSHSTIRSSFLEKAEDSKPSFQKDPKKLGFFIVAKKHLLSYQLTQEESSKQNLPESIKKFLLQTELPEEVKKELQESILKIKTEPYSQTSQYILVPYTLTKKSQFPFGFHNVSITRPQHQSGWFEDKCYFNTLYKEGNSLYLCYLMDGYKEYLGIRLDFIKKHNQNFLLTKIDSPPLSIIKNNRVIPHALIRELKVRLSCGREEELTLVKRIGLSHTKKDFNKSFFTPFIIQKASSCELNSLKKISLFFLYSRKYSPEEEKLFELKL